jgi:hypothetical protein
MSTVIEAVRIIALLVALLFRRYAAELGSADAARQGAPVGL